MADNYQTRDLSGTAVTFASKDVGGVQHARAIPSWHNGTAQVDVSTSNPLPVVTAQGRSVPITVQRPANTTAYAAGAVVGGVLSFPLIGPSGGVIQIVGASLMIDSTALIPGEASYTLHLYAATPPSAFADGAAWNLPSGDQSAYRGSIVLGTPVDLGSTLYVEVDNLTKQRKLIGTGLWGYLVTAGAYTPTSGRLYYPTLQSVA